MIRELGVTSGTSTGGVAADFLFAEEVVRQHTQHGTS